MQPLRDKYVIFVLLRLWDSRSRSKDPLMILEDAKDAVTCVSSVAGEAQIVTSSVDGKVR
jgi:hypothetical protein